MRTAAAKFALRKFSLRRLSSHPAQPQQKDAGAARPDKCQSGEGEPSDEERHGQDDGASDGASAGTNGRSSSRNKPPQG